MPGAQGDSLDFMARYKGWVVYRAMSITSSTKQEEIARYLVAVREDVDKRAFDILGVDRKTIESYASTAVKTLKGGTYSSMVDAYKTLGTKSTEEMVAKATSGREELAPFAKAYLLRSIFSGLNIDFYINGSNAVFGKGIQAPKAGANPPFDNEAISFMAKYGTWISVKKMSISEKTKPEEVAAHLSSIRIAVDRKIAETLGIDTFALEEYASAKTNGMRKSAANLEKIAEMMASGDLDKEVQKACGTNQKLSGAARTHVLGTMLRNIKIDLDVSPDTLMDMFPGLKIPKPKGRMPGQKGKKKA